MTTPWRIRSCFPTTKLAASWKPYLRRRNRNHNLSSCHEQLATLLHLSPCIFLSALFQGFSTMMCSDVLIFRSSKSRVDPRSLASIVIHSTSLSAIQRPPLINASTPHQIHPASLGFVPRQQIGPQGREHRKSLLCRCQAQVQQSLPGPGCPSIRTEPGLHLFSYPLLSHP